MDKSGKNMGWEFTFVFIATLATCLAWAQYCGCNEPMDYPEGDTWYDYEPIEGGIQ